MTGSIIGIEVGASYEDVVSLIHTVIKEKLTTARGVAATSLLGFCERRLSWYHGISERNTQTNLVDQRRSAILGMGTL